MTPPLTAQVSAPSPVPERPDIYIVLYPNEGEWHPGTPWTQQWRAEHASQKVPGSVVVRIPASSPTPETQPAGQKTPRVPPAPGVDAAWSKVHHAYTLYYADQIDLPECTRRVIVAMNALLTSRPQQPAGSTPTCADCGYETLSPCLVGGQIFCVGCNPANQTPQPPQPAQEPKTTMRPGDLCSDAQRFEQHQSCGCIVYGPESRWCETHQPSLGSGTDYLNQWRKKSPEPKWRERCRVYLCASGLWIVTYGDEDWYLDSDGSGWSESMGARKPHTFGIFDTESAARAALASAPPPPEENKAC